MVRLGVQWHTQSNFLTVVASIMCWAAYQVGSDDKGTLVAAHPLWLFQCRHPISLSDLARWGPGNCPKSERQPASHGKFTFTVSESSQLYQYGQSIRKSTGMFEMTHCTVARHSASQPVIGAEASVSTAKKGFHICRSQSSQSSQSKHI